MLVHSTACSADIVGSYDHAQDCVCRHPDLPAKLHVECSNWLVRLQQPFVNDYLGNLSMSPAPVLNDTAWAAYSMAW